MCHLSACDSHRYTPKQSLLSDQVLIPLETKVWTQLVVIIIALNLSKPKMQKHLFVKILHLTENR